MLFGGYLVRRILAADKTETRRPLRPAEQGHQGPSICPWLEVGDRLWVRETWASVWGDGDPCACEDKLAGYHCHEHDTIEWRADTEADAPGGWDAVAPADRLARWQPSIFMRRWACRALLPVVSVRAERVQEITDAGAMAEGILETEAGRFTHVDGLALRRIKHRPSSHDTPREAFQALWSSVYPTGPKSWDANPAVWVIGWSSVEVPT